jgi:hypothetical protein
VIVVGASAPGEHYRVHDIGVRVALDAQPRDVLRQIVGNDALACLLGLANAIANIGSASRIVGDSENGDQRGRAAGSLCPSRA